MLLLQDIRRGVLSQLTVSQTTLQAMLKRTSDVSEEVCPWPALRDMTPSPMILQISRIIQ